MAGEDLLQDPEFVHQLGTRFQLTGLPMANAKVLHPILALLMGRAVATDASRLGITANKAGMLADLTDASRAVYLACGVTEDEYAEMAAAVQEVATVLKASAQRLGQLAERVDLAFQVLQKTPPESAPGD